MEDKCLNCHEVLYKDAPLVPLETEDGRHFYTCPKCKGKNEVRSVSTPEGPRSKITNLIK
jgi:NAD-dependent SIR2 family protein deacetylase